MSRYDHTQYGPINIILFLLSAWFLYSFLVTAEEIRWVLLALFALMLFFAACFQFLRVRDAGDHLAIRFGPLPVFGTKIPFEDVRAVEMARSSLIDGWGVHYLPRRGWIYNIYGYDCVRLQLDNKIIRIGSNEPKRLMRFIQSRIAEN